MEKDQDIYKTPEKGKKKGSHLPLVEMTPLQVRARTLWTTIAFTVVMLTLLGGSIWFIYQQEEKSNLEKSDITEEELTSPFALSPVTNNTQTTRIAIPEPPGPERETTQLEIDPEKMAQAMGEARTANEYLQARDFDKAELHAKKALEIWPDMNAALRLLGVVYTQRGQFDQAIDILEQALKGSPFNVEIYNNLATSYMQKGQLDKAEELLITSLQISPGYRIAFLNLGLLSLLRGDYVHAADYLERALEQMPDDAPPRNNLAVCLIRLGQYEEARQHLDIVINQHPQLPNAYFNKAITYVYEENFPEAMKWIREGAARCSPVLCQQFLSDNDFNAIRGTKEFQDFTQSLYPNLPEPPKN